MKIGVLAITHGGKILAEEITEVVDNSNLLTGTCGVAQILEENWSRYDGFICIMAAGIVVRAIAPLLNDKRTDPCVIVMDEKGNNVISLLSGHIGGGNMLTRIIAEKIHARAVITTASDTHGLVALDLWVKAQNLAVAHPKILTGASSLLVNQGYLKVYPECSIEKLPEGLIKADLEEADLIITNRKTKKRVFTFHPKNLVVGIGCNRGTPIHEFEQALTELFDDLELSRNSIRNFSSIDVKYDEIGLIQFAEKHELEIDFFSRDEINSITNVEVSDAALRAVGAIGVAEPTALLSATTTILLSRKRKWQNITMAVAEAPFTLSARVPGQ